MRGAQVDEDKSTGRTNHKVTRLDVAMGDALFVQVGQARARLPDDRLDDLREGRLVESGGRETVTSEEDVEGKRVVRKDEMVVVRVGEVGRDEADKMRIA